MSFGNIHGRLESGFVDFTGQTIQTITLTTASRPARINLVVHENQNTSATPVSETDIPSRNVGNIQVSAHWVDGEERQFYISTSAEFYGRVIWFIIAK